MESPGGKGDIAPTAQTPRKLSDLLTAFGAKSSPASASRMRKEVQPQNHLTDPLPNGTPASAGTQLPPRATPRQEQLDSSTEAESTSSGDVIHGMSQRFEQITRGR